MKTKCCFNRFKFSSAAFIIGAAMPLTFPVPAVQAQTISAATTTSQILGPAGSLSVTNTGSITSTNPAVSIPNVKANSVVNNGIISGSTTAILISGASGDLTSGLSNSGVIDVSGSNLTYPTAILVNTGADISGGINNEGTLTVDVSSTTGNFLARDVWISGASLTGGFTNSGALTTNANGTVGYVFAGNVTISNSTMSNDIVNSGNLRATATANAAANTASAAGVVVLGTSTVNGDFNNSGVITVTANGGASYTAANGYFGLTSLLDGDWTNNNKIEAYVNNSSATISAAGAYFYNNDISGSIKNDGVISVAVDSSMATSGFGVGLGIRSGSVISGAFENNGVISSTVLNNGSVDATGLLLRHATTDIVGGLTNNGTISATGAGEVSGVSVKSGADISGGVVNNNLISAISNSTTTSADAYGFYALNSPISSNFTNSGTITGSATSSSGHAYGYGLYLVNSNILGEWNNVGLVSALASGDGVYAGAYSVILNNSDIVGDFFNNNLIAAESFASNTSGSAGMYINSTQISGDVINNGIISATGRSMGGAYNGAWSMYFNNGSFITGDLYNNNIIDAKAYSGTSAYAVGLGLNNATLAGDLNNSGVISAFVESSNAVGGSVYALGITSGGKVLGQFTNSGLITAVVSDNSILPATGLLISQAGSDIVSGLTNNGTISATGAGTVRGISLLNGADISGGIINNNRISATADVTGGSPVIKGIYANASPVSGSFINTSILETVGKNSGGSIDGRAIHHINSGFGGDFLNSGTISSSLSSPKINLGSNIAWTVDLSNSDVNGSFINSGTISALSVSGGSTASADAVYLHAGSDIAGDFINHGLISATSLSSANFAGAYPIYLSGGNIGGDIINTNKINAYVNGRGTVYLMGLVLTGNYSLAGEINNSGVISSVLDSTTDTSGTVLGIFLSSNSVLTGGLTNSGIISGISDNPAVRAWGLNIRSAGTDLVGGLNNSGSIIAVGPGLAEAIRVHDAADISGGLTNSGVISGNTGIRVMAASISGGIINNAGGTITGNAGTAISLEGLTALTPITLNGGRVTGDITDDTIANNFSSITVAKDFVTEGDITVSNMTINNDAEFIMSAGDSIALEDNLTNNGTFKGAGTIIADMINNGTVSPGYSIGTQNIVGNYVQNANGRLEIELDGAAKVSDLLDITGTATLDGAIHFSAVNGGFKIGESFIFIEADGGIAGGFSSFSEDLLFVDIGNIQTVGNNMRVSVLDRIPYASIARGSNEKAVARALDSLVANGRASNVDGIFNNLDNFEQASELLISQSGIVAINAISTSTAAMGQVRNIIHDRMVTPLKSHNLSTSNRYEKSVSRDYAAIAPAAGGFGLTTQNNQGSTESKAKEALFAQPSASSAPVPQRKPVRDSIWVEAVGGIGKLNSDENAPGYEYDTYGVTIGIERQNAEHDAKAGMYAAITNTESEVKGLDDESSVDTYQVGVYGAKRMNNIQVNGSVTGALLSFDTERQTLAGDMSADFKGYGLFASSEILYDIPLSPHLMLSPYGGFYGGLIGYEDYTEAGNFNLIMDVEGDVMPSLSSELGIQISGTLKTPTSWKINPTVKTGWSHQYGDTSPQITSRFSAAPAESIKTQGPERARDTAHIGIDLSITGGVDSVSKFYINYDSSFSADAQDHSVISGLQIEW